MIPETFLGSNLNDRILKVMRSVQHIQKDMKVSYGSTNYKAVSDFHVTSVVREAMIEAGLTMVPVRIIREMITGLGSNSNSILTNVIVTFRLSDGVDEIEIASSGSGVDTQDKGDGKAMTYARKYALLNTFLIPTGDDPDQVSSEEMDVSQSEVKGPKPNLSTKPVDKPTEELITKVFVDDMKTPFQQIVELVNSGKVMDPTVIMAKARELKEDEAACVALLKSLQEGEIPF